MTGFLSSSKPSSPSNSSYNSSSPSPPHTFSNTLMEDTLQNSEAIIRKWDLDSSSNNSSCIFQDNREEAKQFLDAVIDLQHAMKFVIKASSSSQLLIQAQNLMQIAMKRLQKEFYTILSKNRYFLDQESVSKGSNPSSVSDDDSEDDNNVEKVENIRAQFSDVSIAEEVVEKVSDVVIADLKAIAGCMIEAGYGKECANIYKTNRKSVINETFYYLGIEKISCIQKMDWEVLEKKIKNWLTAVKIAVSTLFYGEKILCDQVFSISNNIRESCFSEIVKESAVTLFTFPEMVSKYKKFSIEKMFRILDMYDIISELRHEIELIFESRTTEVVKCQAMSSMMKLREVARTLFSEFELAIQKDSSKVVPGGGIHPLSRYVMNYLVFLSDYSGPVSEIIADWKSTVRSPLPESYLLSPIAGDDENSPSCIVSVRLAWLVLVLLCKLDGKAGFYNDVALSYLFLANNLNYVVSKVRESNLGLLLGSDWVSKHEMKVVQYMGNYERIGWSKALTSFPEDLTDETDPDEVKECFCKFNSGFEEAYRKQRSWVIPDPKLRDEVKISLAKKIVSGYRVFYEKHMGTVSGGEVESIVRFVPDDLQNYLSDLFYGAGFSDNSKTSTSTSLSPSHGR